MAIPKITSEQIQNMFDQLWRRSTFRVLVWWLVAIVVGVLFSIALTFTAHADTQFISYIEMGAVAPTCPEPTFENRSDEKKTTEDQEAMDSAVTRCAFHYPNSPCLITFTKMAPQRYHAICGAKR